MQRRARMYTIMSSVEGRWCSGDTKYEDWILRFQLSFYAGLLSRLLQFCARKVALERRPFFSGSETFLGHRYGKFGVRDFIRIYTLDVEVVNRVYYYCIGEKSSMCRMIGSRLYLNAKLEAVHSVQHQDLKMPCADYLLSFAGTVLHANYVEVVLADRFLAFKSKKMTNPNHQTIKICSTARASASPLKRSHLAGGEPSDAAALYVTMSPSRNTKKLLACL